VYICSNPILNNTVLQYVLIHTVTVAHSNSPIYFENVRDLNMVLPVVVPYRGPVYR